MLPKAVKLALIFLGVTALHSVPLTAYAQTADHESLVWGQVSEGLQCALQFDSNVHPEEIGVQLIIRNARPTQISILVSQFSAAAENLRVKDSASNNSWAPWAVFLPNAYASVTISPGKTATWVYRGGKAFFKEGRHYTITFDGTLVEGGQYIITSNYAPAELRGGSAPIPLKCGPLDYQR